MGNARSTSSSYSRRIPTAEFLAVIESQPKKRSTNRSVPNVATRGTRRTAHHGGKRKDVRSHSVGLALLHLTTTDDAITTANRPMLRKQSVTSIVIPNGKMINSDQKECNLNCDLIAVTRPNSAATTAILKLVAHAAIFTKTLSFIVESLDDVPKVIKRLQGLGKRHVQLRERGFRPEYWDVFAECLTECAISWEGGQRCREAMSIWRTLVAFIVDQMRAGYDSELRLVHNAGHNHFDKH